MPFLLIDRINAVHFDGPDAIAFGLLCCTAHTSPFLSPMGGCHLHTLIDELTTEVFCFLPLRLSLSSVCAMCSRGCVARRRGWWCIFRTVLLFSTSWK